MTVNPVIRDLAQLDAMGDLFHVNNVTCRSLANKIFSHLEFKDFVSLVSVNRLTQKTQRHNELWQCLPQIINYSFDRGPGPLYTVPPPFYKVHRYPWNGQIAEIPTLKGGGEHFDTKSKVMIHRINPAISFYKTIRVVASGYFLALNFIVIKEFISTYDDRQKLNEHFEFLFNHYIGKGIFMYTPLIAGWFARRKAVNLVGHEIRRLTYIVNTADVPNQTIPYDHLRFLKSGVRLINKVSRGFKKYAAMFE